MSTQKFKRRLTAILSADVEGYSVLMRDDEAATVMMVLILRLGIAKNRKTIPKHSKKALVV